MQISKIDLKEFKGIKAMKRPMNLSRFNVLIGKNNAGKSSLMQALFLFPWPGRVSPFYKEYSSLSIYDSKGYMRTGGLVFLYSGKAEVRYYLKDENVLRIEIDSAGRTEVFYTEKGKNEKKFNDMSEVGKIEPEDAEKESVYLPYETSFFKDLSRYIDENEKQITKKGLHTKVAKFINRSVDDRFTEVTWKKDGLSLRREDAQYIKIEDLGSGTRKVVTSMLALENINPDLILWDDFDAGMHPSMIKTVLEWLNEHKNWQVVLSTHSIDVLYQILDLKDTEEIKIHLLRKKNDVLASEALNVDELDDLIDANTDPRLLINSILP